MHPTSRFKITRHTHIFQPGTIVEVRRPKGETDAAYFIPDTGYGLPGAIPADALEPCPDEPQTDAYYGKCLLTQVTNFYKNPSPGLPNGADAIGTVKPEHVRAVHYTDCQQLHFHMPKYAWDAGTFRLLNRASGEMIEECPVRERLNGTTMILINTLPYPPGCYELETDWPGGWTHRVRFVKFNEGFPNARYLNPPAHVLRAIKGEDVHLLTPVQEAPAARPQTRPNPVEPPPGYISPPGNVSVVQNDREYRLFDSNGVEINAAFNHERLKKEIWDRLAPATPALEYTQDGRGGSIDYKEGDIKIHFDWEFGGGNAVVIIYIPENHQWEAWTGTPLSRRDEILEFVCRQVIRDQAPGCVYRIYSNSISIIRVN